MKAARNKTIDISVEEGKQYLDRCISISKPVDIYSLLNKTILGDCLEVLTLLPDSFIDLLIVDPPYNLNKDFHGKKFKKTSDDVYEEYTETWVKAVLPHLKKEATIYDSVPRAEAFLRSPEYENLRDDLDTRVYKVQAEIAIAAFIDNVNLRGRVIEYLITDNGSSLKMQIIDALNHNCPLPEFKTEDKLGDYSKRYPDYCTETDIKTKVLFLDGNPKAYNIDKLLEFLSSDDSVYMIYLLGVDECGHLVSRLCSAFDPRLIEATNIQHHWAGRNTRGVTQFIGSVLRDILLSDAPTVINRDIAYAFLDVLISR